MFTLSTWFLTTLLHLRRLGLSRFTREFRTDNSNRGVLNGGCGFTADVIVSARSLRASAFASCSSLVSLFVSEDPERLPLSPPQPRALCAARRSASQPASAVSLRVSNISGYPSGPRPHAVEAARPVEPIHRRFLIFECVRKKRVSMGPPYTSISIQVYTTSVRPDVVIRTSDLRYIIVYGVPGTRYRYITADG